jgi:hypothetical protein
MLQNKNRVAHGAASGDQPQRYIMHHNVSLSWSNLERLFTLEAAVGGLELRNQRERIFPEPGPARCRIYDPASARAMVQDSSQKSKLL